MSIRVITEPCVRLVGRQTIDDGALAAFLRDEDAVGWETDSEVGGQKLIETAGRLCYHSYARPRPGGNASYIGHILEAGHGSVLEHCVLNLIVTGVSRSLTHELIRHRAGMGYSQRSQRYCDEGSAAVVVPPLYRDAVDFYRAWQEKEEFGERYTDLLRLNAALSEDQADLFFEIGKLWSEEVEAIAKSYARLAEMTDRLLALRGMEDKTARRKKAREAARSVLPNATETQVFVTGNARALRGVCEQRAVPGADAEMRRFAVALARVLMAEVPNVVPDYRIESDWDGEYLVHQWRKV